MQRPWRVEFISMRSRQVAETYGLAAPALWNSNTFVEKRTIRRGTAILAVGPAGILPADKCTKATGKMPIFPHTQDG